MTQGIVVQVTAEDIKAGTRGDSRWCPIAYSLARMGYKHAKVTEARVTLDTVEDVYGITPVQAERWIKRYDRGYDVDPFTFTVLVPAEKSGREEPR